jgi:hypothetical protein
MTLIEFIEDKIAIADNYRGLDDINPVEIVIEDAYKNKYTILVSHFEPDAVTVPFNVSWINNNPNHKDYKKLLRRVDATSYDNSGYHYVWSVLSTVEEIFAEQQFWKKQADPILGEVDKFGLNPATVKVAGAFFLTDDGADAATRAAISNSDPRMSDARDPLPHIHAQSPATKFASGRNGDNSQFIIYTEADAPNAGDILVVTGIAADGKSATGVWQKPVVDIAYTGPRPASLTIMGPTSNIDSLTSHVLRAYVAMDDGTVLNSVMATWSIESGAQFGIIGANTGVFTALAVDQNEVVRVKATWTDPTSGVTISNTFDITIRDASGVLKPVALQILGPGSFFKDTTATYSVQALFNDGTTALVNPNSFTSSNPLAGNFVNGVLTPDPAQTLNQATVLTATFSLNGFTVSATLNVVVKDTNIYPDSIVINGASSLNENTTSTYSLTVHYSDGTTAAKDATSWSVSDNTLASISLTGVLTANHQGTPGNKNITLTATYTEAGVTQTAQFPVTIVDDINYPVSAIITGSLSVTAGTTAQYQLEVTYKDGSKQFKTPSLWTSSNTSVAAIDNTGLLTAAALASSTAITIGATYSELGVTLSPTLNVQVLVDAIYPIHFGVAMFANSQFTGGVLSPLTADQISMGVSTTNNPITGRAYEHWTGPQDFFDTMLTNTLPNTGGDIPTVTADDEYLYIAYDARITSLSFIDKSNSFPVTMEGVNYPDESGVIPTPAPAPVASFSGFVLRSRISLAVNSSAARNGTTGSKRQPVSPVF